MISHVSTGVRDIAKAESLYNAAVKPLGCTYLSATEPALSNFCGVGTICRIADFLADEVAPASSVAKPRVVRRTTDQLAAH